MPLRGGQLVVAVTDRAARNVSQSVPSRALVNLETTVLLQIGCGLVGKQRETRTVCSPVRRIT